MEEVKKPLRAQIINSSHSTKFQILDDEEKQTVLCADCGHHEFTWIQTDYVVCLDCSKRQPYELKWTGDGVEVLRQ